MNIRFKLNLIHVGIRFVAAIGMLLLVVPSVLYAVYVLLDWMGVRSTSLYSLAVVSIGAGLLLLAIFIILLVIEQIQDRTVDTLYRKQRQNKLALADGYYECQFCGNRRLRGNATRCAVCGAIVE